MDFGFWIVFVISNLRGCWKSIRIHGDTPNHPYKAGRFHSLNLRSLEPFDHQYLGLFFILINQKLEKKASIDLWKRVLGK
ncbi:MULTISPECIES: hypothetical protein [unclassified Sphaerospermopsis]|uniref:hypothetical protein n=1 Tax=unclassified Sphaerospermopsis TaxID=2646443 RepID=UPI0016805542|nr:MULTISPECIES: hypothetical protein [unclassified Sphaerospermopsis]MBD2133153.1 hypothetical protein [Sphaerospermopsis sp. FACHB-1094]